MIKREIIDTERRTPAENAKTFFMSICIGFTVIMVICLTMGSIFADESAKQGILYSWSILAVCVVSATLQFAFFTPVLIKRLSYPLRLLLFGMCLYVVLAATAVVMSWFPADQPLAWVSFTGAYLFIFAVLTALFSFKMRRESRELNEKLSEYRKSNSS